MPRRALLLLAVGLLAGGLRASDPPLVSVLGTCSAMTSNTYPADPVNWFDAQRHSQVIFFAHLLFPQPALTGDAATPWHPPLAWPPAQDVGILDEHRVDAEWLDPAGQRVAFYSLTFPARIRSDWLDLGGKLYIPHTLAMAIGTRDLRAESGQLRLPSVEGQYTVHLSVDGRPTALAFFRMLRAHAPAVAQPSPQIPVPSQPKPPVLTQPQGVSEPVQAR